MSMASIKKPAQQGSHLFSLSNFSSIILPLLGARAPRRICEIGIERNLMTEVLLRFCCDSDVDYVGIDPNISSESADSIAAMGFSVLRSPSLDALGCMEPADVYFVDGDHNYYTVLRELRLIRSQADKHQVSPLLVLHDVGWPCDRRDLYYLPHTVPEDARKPSSYNEGVSLGTDHLIDGGIAPNGDFAWSKVRGGPDNGVLTAVEDFIASESQGWTLTIVPGLFGLGILCDLNAQPEGVQGRLDQLSSATEQLGDLLAILEYNRLDLYTQVLARDRDLIAAQAVAEERSVRIRTLQNDNAALKEELQHRETQIEKLQLQLTDSRQIGEHLEDSRVQLERTLVARDEELRVVQGKQAELSETLGEKDACIAALNLDLDSCRQAELLLERLRAQLCRVERELVDKSATLDSLRRSTTWALTQRLHLLENRLRRAVTDKLRAFASR